MEIQDGPSQVVSGADAHETTSQGLQLGIVKIIFPCTQSLLSHNIRRLSLLIFPLSHFLHAFVGDRERD